MSDKINHSGVKGMKWGVRKSGSGYIKPKSTLSRKDRKEQNFLDDPTKVYNKVYKRASSGIRKGTRDLNNKSEYKGKDFKTPSPTRKKYYKEYSNMVTKQLNAAATTKAHPFTLRSVGMSPKRTLQMKMSFDYEKELRANYDIAKADTKKGVRATKKEVRHVDSEPSIVDVELEFELSESGHLLTEEIEHSDNIDLDLGRRLVGEILSHDGVKGMKWGYSKGIKNAVGAAIGVRKPASPVGAVAGIKAPPNAPAVDGGVPDEYQPTMEETTLGGKKGFKDKDGTFFEGSLDDARKDKYATDLRTAQNKMNAQKNEQNYRSSMKRHVDDAMSDIKKGGQKVKDFGSNTIAEGKSLADSFFSKFKKDKK